MATVGLILTIVGGIVAFVGAIMVLIQAFKVSVLWGLGSLFVPLVSLIFVIMNWGVAKKGFLIQLAGLGLLILGTVLTAVGAASAAPQG
ncbi:MAG TPA: hypothetical protein PK280_03865 [Planctomycetota bacterium]|nr:hypothetical protein [Planctomycetota bacterium]